MRSRGLCLVLQSRAGLEQLAEPPAAVHNKCRSDFGGDFLIPNAHHTWQGLNLQNADLLQPLHLRAGPGPCSMDRRTCRPGCT